RARAAVARVAADVAARQVEVVAEEVDKELARLDVARVRRAVDGDADVHRDAASCAARVASTSARWSRYSALAWTSDGGSIPAPRTAAATPSGESAVTRTGTASMQPSATRTEPLTLAAALQMHVPSAPSVTAAKPSFLPAGIEMRVSSSPGPTAVM